jgi:hypothetical protein
MSMKKKLLESLRDDMKKEKMGKYMKDKSPMKVSIMADSPEALKEGLEMAEEVMEGEGPMGDIMNKAEMFRKARMKKDKKD